MSRFRSGRPFFCAITPEDAFALSSGGVLFVSDAACRVSEEETCCRVPNDPPHNAVSEQTSSKFAERGGWGASGGAVRSATADRDATAAGLNAPRGSKARLFSEFVSEL